MVIYGHVWSWSWSCMMFVYGLVWLSGMGGGKKKIDGKFHSGGFWSEGKLELQSPLAIVR